jgi:hypothetical protein
MGTITISFNPDDLKDCKRALDEMQDILWLCLGPAEARRLLSEATPSRRLIGVNSNVELMAWYVVLWRTHRVSGVKQYADVVAKMNGTLPRDKRRGPRGSMSPETLAKQIRREKKRAAKNPAYRKVIESVAETYLQRIRVASERSSAK